MTELVIRARGLGKAYHIYSRPVDRLKQALLGRHRRYYREFWALRDVDLDVERGCAMAVVGRNGSGKSTLLQLVAGTLTPSEGSIETVGGRIAALLELGSGFNPEFTGRENVYLNAAILGLTDEYVDAHFNQMLDFSELHDFIDQPVKTYSSGMFVRLAFSVQVFSEPQVLIVDEALSVGDVFFQQKCFDRLRKLREAGVTLLFVTHDTAAVQMFCDQALLLEAGSILFRGRPEECVTRYHALSKTPLSMPAPEGVRKGTHAVAKAVHPVVRSEDWATQTGAAPSRNLVASVRSRHGARDLEIVGIFGLNEQGVETLGVGVQKVLQLLVHVTAQRPVRQPTIGVHVYDRMGTLVFAAGSQQLGVELPALSPGQSLYLRLGLTCNLYPGTYTLSVVAGAPSPEGPNTGVFHDVIEGLGPLAVHADGAQAMPFFGIAQLPLSLDVIQATEEAS
jgi:ABC-type polysaccharide/polyol phosphate transport system ATPase subunit